MGNLEDGAILRLEVRQKGEVCHHFLVNHWQDSESNPPSGGPHDLFSGPSLALIAGSNTLVGSIYRNVRIDTGSTVGVFIPANSHLVLNGHWINTSDKITYGETEVEIEVVPPEQMHFLARPELPGSIQIAVPYKGTSVTTGEWNPQEDVAVLLMTSHMHRHGQTFTIWKVEDGQETQVYFNNDWAAPPLQVFPDPLVLRKSKGAKLKFECQFANDDVPETIGFGPSADTNEMCIAPVFYVKEVDALLDAVAANPDVKFSIEAEPYGTKY